MCVCLIRGKVRLFYASVLHLFFFYRVFRVLQVSVIGDGFLDINKRTLEYVFKRMSDQVSLAVLQLLYEIQFPSKRIDCLPNLRRRKPWRIDAILAESKPVGIRLYTEPLLPAACR